MDHRRRTCGWCAQYGACRAAGFQRVFRVDPAHEIPQELGDFAVLLNSGYSRSKALLFNFLSSLASVAGGVIAYFVLEDSLAAIPYILAVAAGSFIYIAVADLIPHMHRKTDARNTAWQIALMAAGIATIVVTDMLLH